MNVWRMVRLASLALILAGSFVLGTPAEPAAAISSCNFCVTTCPVDIDAYCNDRGCYEGYRHCEENACSGHPADIVYCSLW